MTRSIDRSMDEYGREGARGEELNERLCVSCAVPLRSVLLLAGRLLAATHTAARLRLVWAEGSAQMLRQAGRQAGAGNLPKRPYKWNCERAAVLPVHFTPRLN